MTENIKVNINDPEKLERLYREDRKSFESGFEKIYTEIANTEMAKFWKSRLDFEKTTDIMKKLSLTDIFVMIAVCLFAVFLIRIPDIFNVNATNILYYEKNAGIIVFMAMSAYTVFVNKDLSNRNLIITILTFAVCIIYINLLPNLRTSSQITLAFIHMPLLMWCFYGLVFINFDLKDKNKRIEFIRHNGDLAIIGAIILIAGGAVAIITFGLFQAIGMNIQKFYFKNIIISGLVSAPVLTSFVLKNYNTVTNKIAPVIAKIFSPVVLLTLIVYLLTIAITGKDPYNDREFLLVFNLMLIGVMAIIVFSASGTSSRQKQRFNELVLFILSIVTLITNLIALSAIFYRLGEYGITPNRLAILGSNLLIFINLILITIDLFKINFRKTDIEKVGITIASYLPVYIIWVLIVIFTFPVIFGMK
jgi:hypothetical protein